MAALYLEHFDDPFVLIDTERNREFIDKFNKTDENLDGQRFVVDGYIQTFDCFAVEKEVTQISFAITPTTKITLVGEDLEDYPDG